MYEEDILTLIPQKPPFVMVGKLLYSDDNITKTSFVITADNVLVINGEFSEAGLMENMAQTAAVGEGNMARIEDRPIAIGYIGAVKNLEVVHLPKIGDELMTEIKVETRLLNIAIACGKVWCNEQMIAQCEMKIFINKIND
ncbi:MAG: 3-hydroxyacyl-ACP dehydratase [Mucilaginibacter sp.]|nr:3-hydroxyacyl-ACP dehydratase [Mucilaginibacter sp.]